MSVDRDPLPASGMSESADAEGEGAGSQIDLAVIRDVARFVLGAPRRHKLLTLFVFLAVLGLTRMLLWVLPRTYHVESTLLAQKSGSIGALALPERTSPSGEDAPTKLATETVLRRDNLIALVERTDLQKKWKESRPPATRLRDWVMVTLGRAPTEADEFEALVAMLESRITVTLAAEWTGEGSMTFGVDWPDAEMAYRLTNAVQQSFLEARHVSEIDNFTEAISILQARADETRKEIDSIALKVEEASAGAAAAPAAGEETPVRAEGSRRPRSPAVAPTAPVDTAASEAAQASAAKIKATWEGKKAAIRDLEDIRKRRLTELQAKLADQRATYADSHPLVIDTKRGIEMLSQESPQMGQLHQEEADLRAQYRELTGFDPDAPTAGLSQLLQHAPGAGRSGASGSRRSVAAAAAPDADDDRTMEFLRAQLRMQMQAYDRVMERIDAVRMELDTAEVAFKYRYSLIHPAQMPTAPSKPKVTLINIAGVIAAFLLALLAALAADFVEGRILHRWQVESMLGLPVLGEMQLKP